MDIEVIIYAMQLSVEANKRNIQYIKAILNNWSKSGIKTLLQAKEENQSYKSKKDILKNNIDETDEEKTARKIKELEAIINEN